MEYLELWSRSGAELVSLDRDEISVGRAADNDVVVDDPTVSRMHAVLVRYSGGWAVRDLGSSNGTYVAGSAVVGERRLADRDEVRFGEARAVVRLGRSGDDGETEVAAEPPELTRRERQVLVELCRPMHSGAPFPQPATVKEIADRLVVSAGAVKTHLGNLYDKFGILEGSEPRRVRLANEAIRRRAVSGAELRAPER